MIHVGVVDDDETVRKMIENYLNSLPNMQCLWVSESVEEFLPLLSAETQPEIVLMDITLPGMSGIEGTLQLKLNYPLINVMVLSVHHDSDKIFDALRAGASGYILKPAPFAEIKEAIEIIQDGGSFMSPMIARKVINFFTPKTSFEEPLTDKEKEFVHYMLRGHSYKAIAEKMNITINTVRHYIRLIYRKLHVNSRTELMNKFNH